MDTECCAPRYAHGICLRFHVSCKLDTSPHIQDCSKTQLSAPWSRHSLSSMLDDWMISVERRYIPQQSALRSVNFLLEGVMITAISLRDIPIIDSMETSQGQIVDSMLPIKLVTAASMMVLHSMKKHYTCRSHRRLCSTLLARFHRRITQSCARH